MEWISFGSMARERAKLSTGSPTRLEKLLGFAPSSPHPAAMESEMALGFAHPSSMENDTSDLMEEDVWGEESSSYAKEDMAPRFHSSHNKRWPRSERDSVFLASLDTGSNGSSSSRATRSFSPLRFSAATMNNITSHPVASGWINNMNTSPAHSIMASHMNTSPGYGPRSAPMKIPLWSKLCSMTENYVDDDGDGEGRLPPHELLAKQHARSQISTFSVIEGAGRTLKGRDMSKVRDAVWKQTGFFG